LPIALASPDPTSIEEPSVLEIPALEPDRLDSLTLPPSIAESPTPAVTRAAARASIGEVTAAALNPALGEVQAYFRQRWRPPQALTTSIEYRLTVNPNGSLEQVTPLSSAAAISLDYTGMPLRTDPFISPLGGDRPYQLRLILKPDGSVQVAPEP
jgi:hypothetical protein